MGRHSGSRRKWKRKSFRRDNQRIESKGGAYLIRGKMYYNHNLDGATKAFKENIHDALIFLKGVGIISGFERVKGDTPLAQRGIDFVMQYFRPEVDAVATISFGIAISQRRAERLRQTYPQTKILLFRPDWNFKQIAHAIKEHFNLLQKKAA